MQQSIYDDGTYRKHNAAWHTNDSEWKARKIAAILEDNHLHPDSIADVGCGAGKIIESLAIRYPSVECHGFDTSTDAAAFWQEIAPGKVCFHQVDFLSNKRRFGLVLNIDVFEHVEDYMGFLRRLSAHADHFIFHIPLEMHASAVLREKHGKARRSVGHLHHFSRETALLTLSDTGFEVIEARLTRLSQETVEGRSSKTDLLNILRKLIGLVSETLSAKLFGGYSLLVLARPARVAAMQTGGGS